MVFLIFFNLNLFFCIYLFIWCKFRISFFLFWEFCVIDKGLIIVGGKLYLVIIFLWSKELILRFIKFLLLEVDLLFNKIIDLGIYLNGIE